MEDSTHELASGALAATVSSAGAELHSLRDEAAGELLWQAGEAWPRHAPVLFPIVGRLNGDRLRLDGRSYPMGQHGFARDRTFTWLERGPAACRLMLEDDAESRSVYPFPFRLELSYAIEGGRLSVDYRLSNPGDRPLLASLGAHPGFRWPLQPGVTEDAHRIVFAEPEPEPLRRVEDDGLLGAGKPSPVRGRDLPLSRALFADGALVFDRPRSRSLRYEATTRGAPALEVAWHGFEELGLWSKEGGAFVCIEPWRGMADPVGFDGAFSAKPGLMHIAPGGVETMGWSVRLVES